jgi:peptide-methionine (R)-S-oxide reductase
MQLNQLSAEEKKVIIDKGTEAPYTGEYDDFFEEGTYV